MKRILVCGGRDFDNWNMFIDAMNAIGVEHFNNEHITVICGGARGADRLAMEWAAVRDIPFEVYKADWETFGKKAGYLRNREMLVHGKPDLVIAFPGGVGTSMMMDMATKANKKVIQIRLTDDGFTYGEPLSAAIKAGAEEYDAIMELMDGVGQDLPRGS